MLKNILYFTIFAPFSAFADNNAAPPPDLLSSFFPLILIFIVFFFFIIRPQQKKMKERQEMVDALKIGNQVVTDSGIYGSVAKINSQEGLILLEVAKNVTIKIKKQNIIEVTESKVSKSKNSPKIIKNKDNKKKNNKK